MTAIYSFLQELASNNNKEWLTANKLFYEEAKTQAISLFQNIYEAVGATDDVSELKIYRQNRDIRFSNDKTPYKKHFGAYFRRRQPNNRGGYYIHIEPQNNFIAVGFYNPEPNDLRKIRQEIANFGNEFQAIMQEPLLVEYFGELHGEAVKTAPKGFSKQHPQAWFIAKKQFLLMRKFSDKEVLSPSFPQIVAQNFEKAQPFVKFLTRGLTQ